MRKIIFNMTVAGLFTAFVVVMPGLLPAEDVATNASATLNEQSHMFYGNIGEINTNAMMMMVLSHVEIMSPIKPPNDLKPTFPEFYVFQITSNTLITRDGKPAALSEGIVGEPVVGVYKLGVDGTLNVMTIRFGTSAYIYSNGNFSTSLPPPPACETLGLCRALRGV